MNDEATSETFKNAMNENFWFDDEEFYNEDRTNYGANSKSKLIYIVTVFLFCLFK